MPRQFHDPHTSIMYLKTHNQNLKLIDPSSWTCGRIKFNKYELRIPAKMSKGDLHKELIGSGEVGRILWPCCIYISDEFALSWLVTSSYEGQSAGTFKRQTKEKISFSASTFTFTFFVPKFLIMDQETDLNYENGLSTPRMDIIAWIRRKSNTSHRNMNTF